MAKRDQKNNASRRESIAANPALATAVEPVPAPKRRAVESRPNAADLALMFRVALIVVVGCWIYGPALNGDWLWDDDFLIRDNALVHTSNGLWLIWAHPGVLFDYMPLKVSIDWIEWHLWGANTIGYHVVNLGLHLLSAILLWRFLARFGLEHAWLGGLIFAVHPILVESVAWMAELKNTLSLPFFLLAMGAWLDFDDKRRNRDYESAVVLFLLAMLAKPTMIMFPFVVLLYAWWKRGRIVVADLKASAPFFALSLVLGLATVWFLHRGMGDQQVVLGDIPSRLATAALAMSFYFGKCFLPVDLMTIYPRWVIDPPSPAQFLPWLVLGGVVWFLWTKRQSWGRHALLGLGFFLINLAPFLGLNAGSYMKYTWVMDHILYIPIIGLIGLTVAALGQIEAQLSAAGQWIGGAFLASMLALMAWSSHEHATIYLNLETLWRSNIELNPDAALPHNDLSFYLGSEGKNDEAVKEARIAVQLDPTYPDAIHNLGILLIKTGDLPGAVAAFQTLLRMNIYTAESHYHLGLAYDMQGRPNEAMEQYRQVPGLDRQNMGAYNNLAIDLVQQKRFAEAIAVFQAGLKINPDDDQIKGNLAKTLEMEKNATPAK